ncbi:PIN-like domain-containing protein [Saccharothrix sp. BKS2]|uniref:PIN-like domain-containing protein n=1 Tax=Saccharothrix sp. BKS2 TaxID=3064400 RepID=UPI0039EC2E6F
MADESSAESRGILDGFGAYRTARPDHHRDLLARGLVVLDTDTLLSLYRCTPQARSDLLGALRRTRGRLWVPHQVLADFWRRREAALSEAEQATARAARALRKAEEQAVRGLRSWADRVSLGPEELPVLERVLRDAHEHVVARLTEATRQEAAVDTEEDPVVADLDGLLFGRVGDPLPPEEHRAALAEAAGRDRDRVPPGGEGDYLVWRQVLAEAARRGRDVLLVTGETAEGWWRLDEHGNARGPRPELYEELREVAGVRLFTMRPDAFLRHAHELLGPVVREESVDDVERALRQANTSALQVLAFNFVEVFLTRDLIPDYHSGDGHVVLRAGDAGGRRRAFLVDPPFAEPNASVKWVARLVRTHTETGGDDVVVFPDRPGDRVLDGLANLGIPVMWPVGDHWAGSDPARERGWVTA